MNESESGWPESRSISRNILQRNFHPAELLQGLNGNYTNMRLTSPNYGCHPDFYTGLVEDDRFKSIDFEEYGLSEFVLQTESGVGEILKKVPHIELFYLQYSQNPIQVKKNYINKLMTRESFQFSRQCELYGDYTR